MTWCSPLGLFVLPQLLPWIQDFQRHRHVCLTLKSRSVLLSAASFLSFSNSLCSQMSIRSDFLTLIVEEHRKGRPLCSVLPWLSSTSGKYLQEVSESLQRSSRGDGMESRNDEDGQSCQPSPLFITWPLDHSCGVGTRRQSASSTAATGPYTPGPHLKWKAVKTNGFSMKARLLKALSYQDQPYRSRSFAFSLSCPELLKKFLKKGVRDKNLAGGRQ